MYPSYKGESERKAKYEALLEAVKLQNKIDKLKQDQYRLAFYSSDKTLALPSLPGQVATVEDAKKTDSTVIDQLFSEISKSLTQAQRDDTTLIEALKAAIKSEITSNIDKTPLSDLIAIISNNKELLARALDTIGMNQNYIKDAIIGSHEGIQQAVNQAVNDMVQNVVASHNSIQQGIQESHDSLFDASKTLQENQATLLAKMKSDSDELRQIAEQHKKDLDDKTLPFFQYLPSGLQQISRQSQVQLDQLGYTAEVLRELQQEIINLKASVSTRDNGDVMQKLSDINETIDSLRPPEKRIFKNNKRARTHSSPPSSSSSASPAPAASEIHEDEIHEDDMMDYDALYENTYKNFLLSPDISKYDWMTVPELRKRILETVADDKFDQMAKAQIIHPINRDIKLDLGLHLDVSGKRKKVLGVFGRNDQPANTGTIHWKATPN